MRFREFLRSRGILSDLDVLAVGQAQERHNVFFGTIAHLLDLLTVEQISTILERQSGTGRLFGEIAIELGYMTAEQVLRVLELQDEKHVRFGEMAVALRYITAEQLRDLLDEYATLENREAEA